MTKENQGLKKDARKVKAEIGEKQEEVRILQTKYED